MTEEQYIEKLKQKDAEIRVLKDKLRAARQYVDLAAIALNTQPLTQPRWECD